MDEGDREKTEKVSEREKRGGLIFCKSYHLCESGQKDRDEHYY